MSQNIKPIHRKVKFTPQDDAQLRSLVQKFGTRNWPLITKNMPGRTERQCKERWEYYLSPTINRSPWTPEEDAYLINLYCSIGPKWVMISKFFQRRTDAQIKNRYQFLKRQNKIAFPNIDVPQMSNPETAAPTNIELETPSDIRDTYGSSFCDEIEEPSLIIDEWFFNNEDLCGCYF